MCSLSKNSCAKAFHNWSRGKNHTGQKYGGGRRLAERLSPPPPLDRLRVSSVLKLENENVEYIQLNVMHPASHQMQQHIGKNWNEEGSATRWEDHKAAQLGKHCFGTPKAKETATARETKHQLEKIVWAEELRASSMTWKNAKRVTQGYRSGGSL